VNDSLDESIQQQQQQQQQADYSARPAAWKSSTLTAGLFV